MKLSWVSKELKEKKYRMRQACGCQIFSRFIVRTLRVMLVRSGALQVMPLTDVATALFRPLFRRLLALRYIRVDLPSCSKSSLSTLGRITNVSLETIHFDYDRF